MKWRTDVNGEVTNHAEVTLFRRKLSIRVSLWRRSWTLVLRRAQTHVEQTWRKRMQLLRSCVCSCKYHSSRHGLDNPGVLWSDEAETVEGSQVTVDLLLKTQSSPNLSTKTHPKLKHHRPRYTHTHTHFNWFYYKHSPPGKQIQSLHNSVRTFKLWSPLSWDHFWLIFWMHLDWISLIFTDRYLENRGVQHQQPDVSGFSRSDVFSVRQMLQLLYLSCSCVCWCGRRRAARSNYVPAGPNLWLETRWCWRPGDDTTHGFKLQ